MKKNKKNNDANKTEKMNLGKYVEGSTEYLKSDVDNYFYEHKEEIIAKDVRNVKPDESNENFLDHVIDKNKEVIDAKLSEQAILNKYAASKRPLEALADKEVAKMNLQIKEEELSKVNSEVEENRKICEEKISDFSESLTKIKRGFFSSSLGLCLLTIAAMTVDAISIFDVLKMTLLQAPALTYALCGAITAVLDFLPTTMCNKIQDITKNRKRVEAIIVLSLSLLAFGIMYASLVKLRIANVHSYSQTGAVILFDEASSETLEMDKAKEESDPIANAIVFVMNLIPFSTSVLLFGFSMDKMKKDDEANILLNYLNSKNRKKTIEEEIQKLNGRILILENDKTDYVSLQEDLYKVNVQIAEAQSKEIKALTRKAIMELRHTPEDTSFLASSEANAY